MTIGRDGGEGTAGTAHTFIALRNINKQACVLNGYAGIVLLYGKEKLPVKVRTQGPAKPPAVKLQHLQYAWFILDSTTVDPGNEGAPCDPPANVLQVDLPQGGGPVPLPEDFKACGGGQVVVHPFQTKRP